MLQSSFFREVPSEAVHTSYSQAYRGRYIQQFFDNTMENMSDSKKISILYLYKMIF